MKTIPSVLLAFVLLFSLLIACNTRPGAVRKTKARPEKRVLLFTKTAPGSYRHQSIEAGIAAVQQLGQENGFLVDATEDSAFFTDDNLSHYSALIFLSSNQDVLNAEQELAFQRYIRAGGGFVGIHIASGTERDWPWFGRMIGGVFVWHPPLQPGVINIVNATHPATKGLPARWQRTDEWYLFRDLNPDVQVLATLDSATFSSERHPDNYPFAWYHEFEGGRVFYTAGGHSDEDYSDPLFLKHILGGIIYAIGDNHELDYVKAAGFKDAN